MNHSKRTLASTLFAFLVFFAGVFGAHPASAAGPAEGSPTAGSLKANLQDVGKGSGYKTTEVDQFSLAGYIGTIIQVFLSVLGIIFVVLVIVAGYNWMTAQGDAAKMEKAKDTIWRAVIGLIIVVGAYAIWQFISHNLLFKGSFLIS